LHDDSAGRVEPLDLDATACPAGISDRQSWGLQRQFGLPDLNVAGGDGAIGADLNGPVLTHPGGTEELLAHSSLHYPCIENVVESLEGKAELASSGETAMWTDWVTEQVVRSNVK
jgi:hypothetical protein